MRVVMAVVMAATPSVLMLLLAVIVRGAVAAIARVRLAWRGRGMFATRMLLMIVLHISADGAAPPVLTVFLTKHRLVRSVEIANGPLVARRIDPEVEPRIIVLRVMSPLGRQDGVRGAGGCSRRSLGS